VPVFHPGDAYRSLVRIHTKQIESGAVFLMAEDGDNLITEDGDLLVA
jgi:hypothetical protein